MVDTGLCKKVKIRFEEFLKLLKPSDVASAIISAQRRGIIELTVPRELWNIMLNLFPNLDKLFALLFRLPVLLEHVFEAFSRKSMLVGSRLFRQWCWVRYGLTRESHQIFCEGLLTYLYHFHVQTLQKQWSHQLSSCIFWIFKINCKKSFSYNFISNTKVNFKV